MHFLNDCKDQNFIWVSHMGESNPRTWFIFSCSPSLINSPWINRIARTWTGTYTVCLPCYTGSISIHWTIVLDSHLKFLREAKTTITRWGVPLVHWESLHAASKYFSFSTPCSTLYSTLLLMNTMGYRHGDSIKCVLAFCNRHELKTQLLCLIGLDHVNVGFCLCVTDFQINRSSWWSFYTTF